MKLMTLDPPKARPLGQLHTPPRNPKHAPSDGSLLYPQLYSRNLKYLHFR